MVRMGIRCERSLVIDIITDPAEPDKSLYAGILYVGRVYNSATETNRIASPFQKKQPDEINKNIPQRIGRLLITRLFGREAQSFGLREMAEQQSGHLDKEGQKAGQAVCRSGHGIRL